MHLHLDLMPEEEKILEAPPPKTIVVRYGYLMEIGEFPSDLTGKVGCGTKLVIRTDRGIELGEMLTTTCGNGGCNKSITRDKLLDYIEKSGGKDYPFTESGRIPLRPPPPRTSPSKTNSTKTAASMSTWPATSSPATTSP